jgi:uncharacterized membrane protein YeaQ/YmgE (transglycosylase-associated protein family)
MTLIDFLLLLVVAAICGAVAQTIAGFSRGGCLVSIAVGFVGALIGRWLAGALSLPPVLVLEIGTGTEFPVVWSVIGGVLFALVLGLLTKKQRR